MLLMAGCRYGLPDSEARDMRNVQTGWMQLLEVSESKFETVAERHQSFITAIQDTTNHWRQSLIQQDTLLHLRIDHLTHRFEHATRRHLCQLKNLRKFLVANDLWLRRTQSTGSSRRAARSSWEARSTQFQTMYNQIETSRQEFDVLQPEYEQISKMLPGMTATDPQAPAAIPKPLGLQPL